MLKLRKSVVVSYTDYGAAVLDTVSGSYFTLNDTGASVLKMISEGTEPEQAAMHIASLYADESVQPATFKVDVDRLIESLKVQGLITGDETG